MHLLENDFRNLIYLDVENLMLHGQFLACDLSLRNLSDQQRSHQYFSFNPNLYGGGGKFPPRQFFATAQKRFALDC